MAFTTKSDLLEFIKAEVSETQVSTVLSLSQQTDIDAVYDLAIKEGIDTLSKFIGAVKEKTGTWNDELITLSSWDKHFSEVLSIEHPTDQEPKEFLTPKDYDVYTDTGTVYFHSGSNGYDYKILYTGLLTITDSECDLPISRATPFSWFCASTILRRLGIRTLMEKRTAISVDSVNRLDKAYRYLKTAKDLQLDAFQAMGIATLFGIGGTKPSTYFIGYSEIDKPLQVYPSDTRPETT